jgi:hypothetical protein
MPIRGPANRTPPILHDYESMGVGKGKRSIAKPGEHSADLGQLSPAERLQGQGWKRLDECKKLRCAMPVIPPKKPTVAFRNHRSRRHKRQR